MARIGQKWTKIRQNGQKVDFGHFSTILKIYKKKLFSKATRFLRKFINSPRAYRSIFEKILKKLGQEAFFSQAIFQKSKYWEKSTKT